MIVAFVRYLLILGVLLFGILKPEIRIAEGDAAVVIAGIAFIIYFWVIRTADGIQNTSRNVARIFLLRLKGPAYHHQEANAIQEAITPISSGIFGLAFIFVSPLLIAVMVFTIGGWWTLGLVAAVTIFGPFFTAPYRKNLRKIDLHLKRNPLQMANFAAAGYPPLELHQVVTEAIENGRDPQEMWAEELEIATAKRLTNRGR